jgi:hypothetical protein
MTHLASEPGGRAVGAGGEVVVAAFFGYKNDFERGHEKKIINPGTNFDGVLSV